MWYCSTCTKLLIVSFVVFMATASHAKETIEIETPSGQREAFSVGMAVTPEEQERGLMFVKDMPEREGMLFVYNAPQRAMYWMKNTYIPLDMLFFDESNTLVHIEHSATPLDLTPRGPDYNAVCAVLELNGGTANKLGIQKGTKLLSDSTQECLQSAIK